MIELNHAKNVKWGIDSHISHILFQICQLGFEEWKILVWRTISGKTKTHNFEHENVPRDYEAVIYSQNSMKLIFSFFRLQALLNYMKLEDYGIMVKDPCRWISPIWILVFLQRVLMLKVIFIGIIITIIQWLISIFIIWPNLFVQWVMICMSLMYDERVNKRKRKKLCCSGWKKNSLLKIQNHPF